MYPLEGEPQEQGLEPSLQLLKVPSAIQDGNNRQSMHIGEAVQAPRAVPWPGSRDGSKPDWSLPYRSHLSCPLSKEHVGGKVENHFV